MKKTILWLCAAFALVLLFVGASALYQNLSADYEPDSLSMATDVPEQDAPSLAPDFTVLDWEGKEVSLSDFRGTPVVVNFWASWCPPCKAEMPEFEDAYKKHDGTIIFMMVDMTDGSRETVDIAKEFIEKEGYTFPVYFDAKGDAATTYGASSIPMSFFIDADGNAIARAVGQLNAERLEQGIGMILK